MWAHQYPPEIGFPFLMRAGVGVYPPFVTMLLFLAVGKIGTFSAGL